jgi:hypothetical protein
MLVGTNKNVTGLLDYNCKDYEPVYVAHFRLCATHFPHLCLVEDWLRYVADLAHILYQYFAH